MSKIVKLKDNNSQVVYPIAHSDGIKIAGKNKTLTQKLAEVDSDLGLLIEKTDSETAITFPAKSAMTPGWSINNQSQKWTAQSQRVLYFYPYAYQQGDKLQITGHSPNNSYIAFLTEIPSSFTEDGDVPYATYQRTGGWEIVNSGVTQTFDIPSDCKYILFNAYFGNGSYLPSNPKILHHSVEVKTDTKVDALEEALFGNVLSNCVHETQGELEEVYDMSKVTLIQNSNSYPTTNPSTNRLIFSKETQIPIEGVSNIEYTIAGDAISDSHIKSVYGQFFDANKSIIGTLEFITRYLDSITGQSITRNIDITGSEFANAKYFVLYFTTAQNDSTAIYPSGVNLNKITITLTKAVKTYTKAVDEVMFNEALKSFKVDTVMQNNIDKQPRIASLCRTHTVGSGIYHTTKYFAFAHISDTHAMNKTVQRAVDFLNECDDIDCLVHTGDIQRKSFNDEYLSAVGNVNDIERYQTAVASANKPFLIALGNHDQNGGNQSSHPITLEGIYNRFMKPMVDKGWITTGTNIDATNHATWYYKDFDTYEIRLICLNSFDPLYDGYYTSKGMDDNEIKYSPAQVTFLINTLLSVPANYHVVVALHTPYSNNSITEGDPAISIDAARIVNPDWSDTKKVTIGYHGNQPTLLSASPLLDILAAYKEKTSLTKTYTYSNSSVQNQLGSISVDVDFGDVNGSPANGELAFMAIGHNHDDWIGNFASHNNIKCVCVPGSILTEPDSDLGRGYTGDTTMSQPIATLEGNMQGKSQDAINVYVVRTDLRKVYIIRMGADFTNDARERNMTSIDY